MLTTPSYLLDFSHLKMVSRITCLITFSGIDVRLTSLSFPRLPFPSWRWEQYLLSSGCQEPLLITTAFQRCFRVALQQHWPAPSALEGASYAICLIVSYHEPLPLKVSLPFSSLALFHRPGIAGVVLPVNMKSKVSSTVSFMTRSPFPFRCTNRSSTCIFLPNHVSASTSSMLFLSGSLWSTFVCFAVHLGGGDTWKLNKLTWTALLSRTISYRIFPSRSLNMLKSALRRSRFVIPLF